MLPRGSVPAVVPRFFLSERRAPILPRGFVPVEAPFAPPQPKVDSHAAIWLHARGGSTSSRGGLLSCPVAPRLWMHRAVSSGTIFDAPNTQCLTPSLRPTLVMTPRAPTRPNRANALTPTVGSCISLASDTKHKYQDVLSQHSPCSKVCYMSCPHATLLPLLRQVFTCAIGRKDEQRASHYR
jgi:hypothetical protein